MKRTRHTPEQIVTKLREAEAMLAAAVARSDADALTPKAPHPQEVSAIRNMLTHSLLLTGSVDVVP